MIINEYVGELRSELSFDDFVTSIKSDLQSHKISVEKLKVTNDEGSLRFSCTGDAANVLRKRKDILCFRCDKIGH